MPKYLSGRVKLRNQSDLSADRYKYLALDEAEPNLGIPPSGGSTDIPVGEQYQVISVIGDDNRVNRYWIPVGGGIIPGSLSVYDEGTLVGGVSSTTQLDIRGLGITAIGNNTGQPNPGVAVTITVAPPGNNDEVLFKSGGDFATSSNLLFNTTAGILTSKETLNVGLGGTVLTVYSGTSSGVGVASVGIGTTNPSRALHVRGDLRLTGTIYDGDNTGGDTGDLIVKAADGSIEWKAPETVQAGAGGAISQIQYHDDTGFVEGASNFVWIEATQRIGIGSTQPRAGLLMDVLGISSFSNIEVAGLSTFTGPVGFTSDIKISGITTISSLTNKEVVHVGAGSSLIGNSKFTFEVVNAEGFTKLTVNDLTEVKNLNVTGVATVGYVEIGGADDYTIKTTSGNLKLNSTGGTIRAENLISIVNDNEAGDYSTGALQVDGGGHFDKSLLVGGGLSVVGGAGTNISPGAVIGVGVTLASARGITTTGGDLYVGGVLYADDIVGGAAGSDTEVQYNNGGVLGGMSELTYNDSTGDITISGASYNAIWDKSANALEFQDEARANFGNGNDLQISHTNSLASQNDSNGDSIVDGWTSYIHETGTGALVFKTDGGPGAGAYQFFDTSWRPILKLYSGTSARAALYHGGTEKFITTATGTEVTGVHVDDGATHDGDVTFTGASYNAIWDKSTDELRFNDGAQLVFGTDGTGDLTIEHTGSNSVIEESGTGKLILKSNQVTISDISNNSSAEFIDGGAVELYFNATKRVETTTDGIKISGGLQDKDGELGTSGQLLSSTGTELDWVNPQGLSVENANKINIQEKNDNVTYQIPFSANNGTGYQSLYIDTDDAYFTYNPALGIFSAANVVVGGSLDVGGTATFEGIVVLEDGLKDKDGDLGSSGNVLTSTGSKVDWVDSSTIGRTYTLEGVDSGDNAILRLSDGSTNDDVTITAGANITIDPVAAGGFTIAAVQGAGLALDATVTDVLDLNSGTLSADDPGADRIIFWDETATKLTHLSVGTGLEIDGTQLKATSDAGKTYTLEGVDSGSNAILRLSDGSVNDDVTITAGTGITLDPVAAGGFTISATSDAGKTYTLEGVDSGDNAILRLSDGTTDDDVTITAGTGITINPVAAGGFTIAANTDAGKTYTLEGVDSGDNAILRLSDGSVNDDVTITAGANITIDPVAAGGFTIAAVQGAGLALDASVTDVLNLGSGILSADDPGNDRIIFWDETAGKLTHLTAGSGLTIDGTTITANSDAGKTYTLEGVDSGDNAILRLSDGTTNDDVTITAGANITIDPVAAGGFTIAAVQGAGLALDSTVTDIFNLTTGTLSADDPGADRIVFWDETATKLTHLTVGTGLEIDGTELKATSAAGKTYTLEGVDSGDNAILRLSDGSTNDDVTITAGANITIDSVAAGGFTISADSQTGTTYDLLCVQTGGNNDNPAIRLDPSTGANDDITITGGTNCTVTRNSDTQLTIDVDTGAGGVTDVQVSYTGRSAPCTLPITVTGTTTKTINIPSNSNAFGAKYVQDTEPTGSSVCEGDIWYDTSATSDAGGTIPVGGIIMWYGTIATIPNNWALCNGATHGSVTTPDLRDKFVIGAHSDDGVAKTNVTGSATQSGGSKDAIVVEHNHGITEPNAGQGHLHNVAYSNSDSGDGVIEESGTGLSGYEPTEYATTGITINNSGDAGTNKNLPPYYALAYIMRIT